MHTLSIEQLNTFESVTILASSSEDRKKLIIYTEIIEGFIITRIVVKQREESVYLGINLQEATEIYNNL